MLSRVDTWQVGDAWVQLIDESLRRTKPTWLHHLFLATHALEVCISPNLT